MGSKSSAWLVVVISCACAGADEKHCVEDDVERIRKTAEFTMGMEPGGWGWQLGVTMSGLFAAWECTGDDEVLAYIRNWYDAEIELGVDPGHVNDGAPGPTLLALYDETGDLKYLDVAVELADYFVERYPDIDGALLHAPDELWVDTTFMTAPFLAELTRRTADPRYADAGVAQVLAHADRLQDAEVGLWHHGWSLARLEAGEDPNRGVFWGRGNGWAAGAATELLLRLGVDHPDRDAVGTALARHLEAAASVQHETGGWHTIMDDPATYLESSGTTMLARAARVAHQQGFVGAELALVHDRGRAFLDAQLADDGSLGRVAGPTALHDDPSIYATRPFDEPRRYAQGTYLLLLTTPP